MVKLIPGQVLIDTAKRALGTQYVWGGNSLVNGVDCSGLVQQVFRQFGIELPRVTYEQIGVGASVPASKMNAGDLVFFDTDRSRKGPDHVGIYMGGGKFIHAPRPGQPVQISSMTDSYYMDRLMGVRRVPGVAGSSGMVGTVDALNFSSGGEEVHKTRAELAEEYGMSTAFFNSVPELKSLLGRAVKGQWDGTLFQANLKNTKWWKNTSDSNRKAQIAAKSDPATYKATIEAAQEGARQAAVSMGAILSEKSLKRLAKNIVHFDWNDAQIQNFLGKFIDFNDKKVMGGMAGAAYQQLRGVAMENGVKLTEQGLKNSAAYVVRGLSTMEEEVGKIRQTAMSANPYFAEQIAAGQNLADIANPYVQLMAEELEMPSTKITMSNPLIRSALGRLDNQGQPAPLSLTDFQQELRSEPAWRRTQRAQSNVFSIGNQVLQDMGLMPRTGGG